MNTLPEPTHAEVTHDILWIVYKCSYQVCVPVYPCLTEEEASNFLERMGGIDGAAFFKEKVFVPKL